MKLIIIAVFTLAIFLSGCTATVKTTPRTHLGTERIFDKNYTIGQRKTSYVGEAIVKVKDYKVNRYSAKYLKASDNFTVTGGMITISGDTNTEYAVSGETTLNNQSFKVINMHASGIFVGLLINHDGSVHNKALNRSVNNVILIYDFDVMPPNLKFKPSKNEEIDVNSGYVNYELIYGGTDGKSFSISYREYTSKDMARPAFYQNLTYQVGQRHLRFKDVVLRVDQVDNEKIVFTVISDGI